ncbi:MAG: T9SS type A sorting domain-containing protein [Bacteroidia bacterium]|nr:T9SS type A sorting domain-containing protein [Bacteroidia bacterium]
MSKRLIYLISISLFCLSSFGSGFSSHIGKQSPLEIQEKIVHFGKISAEKRGNQIVLIKWTTQKEEESFKFVIEKSEDKKSYVPIGEVGANRNSEIEISYSFSDLSPFEGQSYYRIKVFDVAGEFEYSMELIVVFDPSNKGLQLLQAFPNPFSDTVKIQYSLPEEGEVKYQFYSETGQEICSGKHPSQKGSNTFILVQDSLPSGRYVLGLMGKDKVLKAVELLKK